MSVRESFNEWTWKVYRQSCKPSFWIISCLMFILVCGVAVLFIKADNIAYKRMIASPSISSCVEYLDKYPRSEHVPAVETLLSELRYKKEKAAYDLVCENTTIENCSAFLSEYPSSEFYPDVYAKLLVAEYDHAISSNDLKLLRGFIENYPESFRVKEVTKKIKSIEDDFYRNYVNLSVSKLTRSRLNEYLSSFPDGRYVSQARAKLRDLNDEDAYSRASSSNTKYAWQQYLSSYPKGLHAGHARSRIKEIEEMEYYENYSLSNGSQPYSSYYGYNHSYDYGCATVRVNAPYNSDLVVVVRYNNSNGRVAGHKYIRKGCTGEIYLPSEKRYQVFFYYGRGWYPKKVMASGVKGGFLNDEVYSKDGNSRYFDWGEGIEYTLTLQANGNFSTSGSNANEFF